MQALRTRAHRCLPAASSKGAVVALVIVVAPSGGIVNHTVATHALAVAAVVLVTSTVVSEQEPPTAPPAQVPVKRRSDFTRVLVLGSVLSLISGMVSAVAILAMGGTVSHHTGNATAQAAALALTACALPSSSSLTAWMPR